MDYALIVARIMLSKDTPRPLSDDLLALSLPMAHRDFGERYAYRDGEPLVATYHDTYDLCDGRSRTVDVRGWERLTDHAFEVK